MTPQDGDEHGQAVAVETHRHASWHGQLAAVDEGNDLTETERAEVTAFGKVKPPMGSHQLRTMAFIFSLGDQADTHIAWLLMSATRPEDAEFHRLLVLACRAHRPGLYEAWESVRQDKEATWETIVAQLSTISDGSNGMA